LRQNIENSIKDENKCNNKKSNNLNKVIMGTSDANNDNTTVVTATTTESTTITFDTEPVQDDEYISSTNNYHSEQSSSNSLRNLASFAMSSSDFVNDAATSTVHGDESTATSPSAAGYRTLARSGSVPIWAKILIPILCVACQVIFYYGQTEPMWKLHVNAEVDVWANATEYTARRTFDVLGLDYEIPLVLHENKDVQTFTYMFAIQELWAAKNLPGTFLPRSAAVLLIVFSGLWPHIKLLMLNLTWFFAKHKTRRTKTLAWLAALGKWSLADVLVVCVMVGVLNLDWVVDPGAIKDGLLNDLPSLLQIVETLYTTDQACDKFLKMDCVHQKRVAKIAKCKACRGLVGEAFTHPEWARSTGRKILNGVTTNGGGKATLRVVGMRGIYYFCGAVILSIFLSLVVDIFDHRAKIYERKREEEARGAERGYRERGGLLLGERPVRRLVNEADGSSNNTNVTDFDDEDDGLETPLLGNSAITDSAGSSTLEIELAEGSEGVQYRRDQTGRKKLFSLCFLIAALVTLVAVYLGAEMPTMERLVYGAGPKLLHEILGVDWQRPYSFQTLMWTTGAAGGFDYMLMGTFGLFCVLGPVVRAVLLFLTVLLDNCCVSVTNLAVIVNFLGSFCAWEVFSIATIMVQMLMPSITDTIIRNPACGSISDDGSCLKIEFNLVPIAFTMIVIGGTSMVGLSWIATGRAMVDEKEYGAVRTESDSGGSITGSSRGISTLSRVMRQHHDYERLQGVEEGTRSRNGASEELDELVFETNQL